MYPPTYRSVSCNFILSVLTVLLLYFRFIKLSMRMHIMIIDEAMSLNREFVTDLSGWPD